MRKFALVLLVLGALVVACGGSVTAAPAKKKPKPQPRLSIGGPLALSLDGRWLIVGDRGLKRLLKIDLRTKRRTVVASGFPSEPVGVAYDDNGRLFVSADNRVYRIDGSRKVVVAGSGARGHSGDGGPATAAAIAGGGGIDVDHDEEIAVAEYDNYIRVFGADSGSVSTAAGNGTTGYAGDGGPARDAALGHPHDVIWRRDKVLVIADSHNGVIRRVEPDGRIRTFASGFGAPVLLEGGPGDQIWVADARGSITRLSADGSDRTLVGITDTPVGLAVDARSNTYVAELDRRRRVLRISPAGRVTVLARAG